MILSELNRRRVFREVGVYAVIAWVALQVVDVLAEPLGFPPWAMTASIYLVILGFVATVFFAWRYDFTLDGIIRTAPRSAEQDAVPISKSDALGAIGVVVPLLPTTPFVLVAAFAYAKSSDRLHAWLLAHRVFGPLIDNWHRYGAISRRAKTAAIVSMLAVIAISLLLRVPTHAIVIQVVVLCGSGLFILTRPLPPGE